MPQASLISGTDSSLHLSLVDFLSRRGNQVCPLFDIADHMPVENRQDFEPREEGLTFNSRSALSISAAIREAVQKLGKLDEVYIHVKCEHTGVPFPSMSWASVRQSIDKHISGILLQCKECLSVLQEQGSGRFFLLYRQELTPPAYVHIIERAIEAFADMLFMQYELSPLRFHALRSTGSEREFSEFIATYLSDDDRKTSRRWVNHSGKRSLFSFR